MPLPALRLPAFRTETWGALVLLHAMLWTQLAWVDTTNFGGYDEWTIHYLVSRGILDIPYANRPVQLLWDLPAALLAPHTFTAYTALYAFYFSLSGWFVFLLCRRLAPGQPVLALLAGCFVLVWAPTDLARLAVERSLYAGFTFGTLLSVLLFLESWLLGNQILLAVGALIAFITARSYEGTLPLLLAAPLLIAWVRRERSRRYWTWAAAWESVVGLGAVLAALPVLFPDTDASYQASVLGLDLHPSRVLGRLVRQFALHLAPLAGGNLEALARPAVWIAVAVFGAVSLLGVRSMPRSGDAAGRGLLVRSIGLGLLLAGLGYGLLVLSPVPTAFRMQFLSAPGVALSLAAAVCLLGSLVRGAARQAIVTVLGAWIVALGTARTLDLQRMWDVGTQDVAQNSVLVQLIEQAPDLKPHTLVVMIDEGRTWMATFGFRHAVQYLYQGRAIGYVWNSWDAMFPTSFTKGGILCVPWRVVRGPWDAPASIHRYEEVVVARRSRTGALVLLEEWPDDLPPLPEGARYAPWARVVALGGPPPPERAILRK